MDSEIAEGRVSKGGVNRPPTTPPEPPKGQNPSLRDPRFVPEKTWTVDEMKFGTYNHMNETLEYIRHVLQFNVRMILAPLWGDAHATLPDKKFWRTHIEKWISEVDLTLGPRTSIQLQGLNVAQDHLGVFVVVQWVEYPQTLCELNIGFGP